MYNIACIHVLHFKRLDYIVCENDYLVLFSITYVLSGFSSFHRQNIFFFKQQNHVLDAFDYHKHRFQYAMSRENLITRDMLW